jgi:hypothetical protein
MTLRDCSLFIRARFDDPTAPVVQVESKLADLDFKHEAKVDDWREKEEQLLNGGWYLYRQGVKGESREQCVVAKQFKDQVPYWA